MHIGYVTCELNRGDELYPGGLATYTFHAASGMQGRGHRVTIFLSGSRDREFEFRSLRVIESAPVAPVWLLPLRKFLNRRFPMTMDRVWRSYALRKSIRSLASKEPLDMLHYSNWKATGLFRVSTPSVLRISSFDPCFDNNPGIRHLDKRLCWYTEELCIRRFRRVFGPGDHLASIIEKELKLRNPIDILPTPFKETPAEPDADFRVPGKWLLVYAGTISRFKGAELLFDLLRRYLRTYDDTVFLLAGKFGTLSGKSVEGVVGELLKEFPGSVTHKPHLGRHELMAAFEQSDAVLVPSLIDNFPNVVLEAMSHQAIVIASDTASLGTLIRDGENGFIVKGRDADHWVERIRDVLLHQSEDRLQRMKASMSASIELHTMQRALDTLEAYYRQSLTTGKSIPRT
jgi:glycosyltransferase involved in cell wall biosynthesis